MARLVQVLAEQRCAFSSRSRRMTAQGLVLAMWLTSTACSPELDLHHGANAEVYVQAFCEDVCEKHDECAPLPERVEECDAMYCFEARLSEDGSCLAEKIEWLRCRVERESCDEYFDVNIDTSLTSACYDSFILMADCVAQYGNGR